jgi:3-oxoadipate enol-lactonase
VNEFTYCGSDGCPLYATTTTRPTRAATGDESVLVLLHGGGPDHHSLVPLARLLAECLPVVLPDIRGYGRSVCRAPSRHTWAQYADDVISLLDSFGARRAIVVGAGLGTTIALRTAAAYPDRVKALVLISVEDIEDDEAKEAEIAFMDAFAARVQAEGIEAGWDPILQDLAPIIGAMVRDAIPRSDPLSVAAAAAIGHDRSFRNIEELAVISAPTLVIPGTDHRHPAAFAENLARVLPQGRLAPVTLSADIRTLDDFGRTFAPVIQRFVSEIVP